MTTLTDFDRLLGSVLESDGPQGLPPGLVEAALAEARPMGQRRPLIPVVDHLGWPPIGWPVPRAASRRFTLVAVVVLLAAAVVASAVLIAGGQPRRLVDDGERIYVWANSQAHLVTADGVTSHTAPIFRSDGCATLVPGTMIVGRGGFGQWHLSDLMTGKAVGSVSTTYAGGERWSPGSAAMALFDLTGRVGLVIFADPAHPVTRWIPVPGVVDVSWSLDGDRLAALVIRDGAIGVVVIDPATNVLTTIETSQRGESAEIGWASSGSSVEVRTAAAGAGGFAMTSTLVDTRSGASITLPEVLNRDGQDVAPGFGALSPDGLRFARPASRSITVFDSDGGVVRTIPTVGPARDLAWSPDGRQLAFRDGDRLAVADVAAETQVNLALSPTDPFAWDRSGDDLIVARRADGGALVERYRALDLELLAWKDLSSASTAGSVGASPAAPPRPSDPASPLCLQLDDDVPSS